MKKVGLAHIISPEGFILKAYILHNLSKVKVFQL